MQEKIRLTADNSARFGQRVHRGKNKFIKSNKTISTTPITLARDGLEDMTRFTYLGSSVDKKGEGGTLADVKVRIGRARAAFSKWRLSGTHLT